MSLGSSQDLITLPVSKDHQDDNACEVQETDMLLPDTDLDGVVNLPSGSYKAIINDGDTENIFYSFASNPPCDSEAASPQRKRKASFLKSLRSASLSISLLAKPSDDRHASVFLAGWNVSNLIQGTGILGIPYAVAQGGWAAVASIFLAAGICCYTGKILINCLYEESKKTYIKRRLRVNFPEVGEAVFKKRGHNLVACVQMFELFGAVIMYIILLGTVLADLLKASTNLGPSEWAAISCIVVLPALFIRRMSVLSWLSMISVFALLGSIVTLIAFGFTKIHDWKLTNIPPFNPTTFPIGFGIIAFSYCGHAVFPSIEASMRKPEQFNSMMNSTFLFGAVVKTLLGTFMVLAFGHKTDEVATVNLHESKAFSIAAALLVVSNVMLAVPLCMFVTIATFDDALLKYFPHLDRNSKYHWVWLLISRPTLLCFGLCLALVIPHFGLLMGFVGSFTGAWLCFIFPCWFYLKLRWNKLSKYQIAFNIFVIVLGFIVGFTGMFFSAKALVKSFKMPI